MQEYRYISEKRTNYFLSSKLQPHQFTILVRSIPVPVGSSVSESVERFFSEYHPSTYLSHSVVRRTNKLQNLIVSITFFGWLSSDLVLSSFSYLLPSFNWIVYSPFWNILTINKLRKILTIIIACSNFLTWFMLQPCFLYCTDNYLFFIFL